jgi:acyl-CoA synthetase (AMP-forming)/AMP-acid ligase II
MARHPTETNPDPEAPPSPTSDEPVRKAILKLCTEAGPERSADVSAIARALGGSPNETVPWRVLIRRIRAEAAALQDEGRVTAVRKGRPVDIRTAKGVIRLALARSGQT